MTTEIATAWEPTERQELFRQLSELLWFDGVAGFSESSRASRLLSLGVKLDAYGVLQEAMREGVFAWSGPPVTTREWRSWEADEAFLEWWAEAFPEVSGPSKTDLLQADGLFWSGLLQGLAAGESRAQQLYVQVKVAADKAAAAAEGAAGTLDGHYDEGDDDDNGWLDDEPQAAK